MTTYYQRLMICICFVLMLSFALYAQGLANNTPLQPTNAADAEQVYKIDHQIDDTVKSYSAMAYTFYTNGWYKQCVEECDKILQRWPDDKSMYLLDTLWWKSYALASLNRWQEAFTTFDQFYLSHMNDQKIYDTIDNINHEPYNYKVHYGMLAAKEYLLIKENKYHDAAIVVEQKIDLSQHPEDDAAKKYQANHSSTSDILNLVEYPKEKAADYFFNAGEYDTAILRYKEILTLFKRSITSDDISLYDRAILQFKCNYSIPIGIAICQMKENHYADALKTYDEITKN